MKDDHRRLESLNPEPDGGRGWPDTDAGRRTRARVEARLEATTLSLEAAPVAWKHTAWLIAAPALVVALAVGLPLLFLRGEGPTGTTAAPAASTTTAAAASTAAPAATTAPVTTVVYQFTGMVLDKAGVGPELCMAVEESLPPQCGGVPVAGLDWAAVPWAETAGDTTWAEALLVGTFDGERFTLTGAPQVPNDETLPEPDPFAGPCPEPSGGWAVTDPALAGEAAFGAAQAYAAAQPDNAGLWIDQLQDPVGLLEGGFDAASFVLNVTFTGDLAGHEAALREIYGGPLCVGGAKHSAAELDSVVAGLPVALTSAEAEAAGIFAAGGASYATDVMRNVVVAEVFAVTGDGQEWVDARYGAGVVELSSMLTAVEGS
jgi:hypothetical protein